MTSPRKNPRKPPVVAVYDAAQRLRERLGIRDRRLRSERVLEAARRRTGLTDFGSDDFRRPLEALLHALDRPRWLSGFGRAAMSAHVVASLSKRLRIEDAIRRHPAIEREVILRPLFIVGMPRTGSTHLHHLLCADDGVRAPLYWQLLEPTPPPEFGRRRVDPRIARAQRAIRRGALVLPELGVLHNYEAEGPEECQFLFDASLMNPLLPAGDEYERWWRTADLEPAYRYYARQLRLLQWRWPGHHWVLKAPFHLWHLNVLARIFPDACFVFTHRDPTEVVPSATSYASARSRAFLAELDPTALGESVLDGFAALLQAGFTHRNTLGEERFLDVAYRDIVNEPLSVVRRIHQRFDYPLSPEAERAMQRYLTTHPQHARGVHRYSLAQFGLSAERIRERYASYFEECRRRAIEL